MRQYWDFFLILFDLHKRIFFPYTVVIQFEWFKFRVGHGEWFNIYSNTFDPYYFRKQKKKPKFALLTVAYTKIMKESRYRVPN